MNFGAKIETFGKSTLKKTVFFGKISTVFGAKIEIFGKSTLKKLVFFEKIRLFLARKLKYLENQR